MKISGHSMAVLSVAITAVVLVDIESVSAERTRNSLPDLRKTINPLRNKIQRKTKNAANDLLAQKNQAQRQVLQQFKTGLPPPPTNVGESGATISNEVFNLVKAIVGVGVLSLPAGIAAFGSAPSALIPALSLITIIGLLSAYGFALIGKVCAYTGAKSYREAWESSVGPTTAWIPAWSATLKTMLACLAFSMVLGDTFTSLLPVATGDRNKVLLGVTVFVLLPLCWMKDLKSLAPFSLLGVMGMAYTALAMTVRFFDGSYADGGSLVEGVAQSLRPSFGSAGFEAAFSPKTLILVCMLSTAYMAHFNAPKFYLELKDNTLSRYYTVVGSSFGLSILLMGFITAIGFATFGAASSGLILNNYSSNDKWIFASRIAVAVSLVFSYPLAFQGARDGIIDLLKIPEEKRDNKLSNMATVAILTVLTIGAATLNDVSMVLALGGATLGNALTYVYPYLMYKATVAKYELPGESMGLTIAAISAVLGVIMGGIGAKMAISK